MTQAAILFDLDGTLIDSVPDLHAAAERMLAREGKDPIDLATIRGFVGHGVPTLIARIVRARAMPVADQARLAAEFVEDYNAHATDLTTLYPGVRPALDCLAARGYALGICTNKPEAPTRTILENLGIAGVFACVVGGDTLSSRKPDPAGVHHGFAQLTAQARLFVGDSEVDAQTALAADVPFALFTEGYRKAPVDQIPHQWAFDHFEALPEIVERDLAAAAG